MKRERGLDRAPIAGGGLVLRIALMPPRPIAPVHGAVAVEEDGRKREVVIELEEREIERVGIDHAHADKLIEQRRERRVFEHLRIDARASQTPHAAQHDEQRLARALRLGKAALDVVVDPAWTILHRRAIVAHRALAILDGFRER